MKTALLIASGVFLAALAATAVSVPAEAKTMKECAAQWKEMKAAKQTEGMKYKDFSKQCMSGGETPAAAPPPAAETKPPPAETTKKESTKKKEPTETAKGGTAGEHAREKACGAEWKADKAAGKIPAGQKWPQYWSECDKRKKAEGM
jgi:hypothetical protein